MAQRTPLYDTHARAGARLVEFAGWEMPVQYAGILAEHHAVRSGVGLFDVSHMGEVVFRGPHALEALGRLFTNDLGKVADGQAQYGCVCRESGGIVDDVVVYRRAADDLLVCVNAGNRQKDFEWLAGHAGGAEVANVRRLGLQNPVAVLPNGVDLEAFTPGAAPLSAGSPSAAPVSRHTRIGTRLRRRSFRLDCVRELRLTTVPLVP